MSRAFVKEPDEGAPVEGLPERQISEHANYVTPAGLEQLEARVGELETRRLELLERDDDPEGELDYVDRDLRYYTARLESAIAVDLGRQPRRKVAFGAAVTVSQPGRRKVAFGAAVTVSKPGGERQTFTIVGEDEADLKQGKISYVSPLAEALLDARAGKSVLWRRPAGDLKLTIEQIDYPEG
jgi:transcription elongation factor GreB